MRLYGKCGIGDPCHDRKHCAPEKGSRTREKAKGRREAQEQMDGQLAAAEIRLIDCDGGNCYFGCEC
jgi:hypothetical protein